MVRCSQTSQYELVSRTFELQNEIDRVAEPLWRARRRFLANYTSSHDELDSQVGPKAFIQAHLMTCVGSSRLTLGRRVGLVMAVPNQWQFVATAGHPNR